MAWEAFEKQIVRELEERGIAGASWALTNGSGLLSTASYGVTSAEKPWDTVRPDTLFRIASNTKITVTLTALQLRAKGLLDLDVPVRAYIPWLHLENAAEERITLRKLLSHTAGLPAEYTPDGFRDEDRCEDVLRKELEDLRLVSSPDEGHYLYSNVGIRLAGAILSRVSGKPFSALAGDFVLKPLGMEHSTFDLNRACSFSLALPHSSGPAVRHYIPVNAARYAAGGLFSSVEDMTRLARLFLNRGAPLLSETDWAEITAPMADMGPPFHGSYCLTLMKRPYGGTVLTGHTGSAPPYRSCIWVLPERNLGICFASNTEGGEIFTNDLIPNLFVREFNE